MIKYSIIYPYYDRPDELLCTLSINYSNYNTRNDFEYVIVEDSKNFEDEAMHKRLMEIVDGWHLGYMLDPVVSYNASHKYNLGVEKARGDIILLSNPEVFHGGDCLKILDNIDMSQNYVVFDCAAVNKVEIPGSMQLSFEFVQWYEHKSIRRNYHFLSAISKENYWKAGGFHEGLLNGIAYEDDFFLARVKHTGLPIINIEHPSSAHIEHPRDYKLDPELKERLRRTNEDLWIEANRTGNYY